MILGTLYLGDGMSEGHAEPSFILPAGTVTFLLTDDEGSVRMWERDPAAMEVITSRLGSLIGDTVGAGGGVLPRARSNVASPRSGTAMSRSGSGSTPARQRSNMTVSTSAER
jgi:hypothetical protein